MANAMFRELGHGVAPQNRAKTAIRANARPEGNSGPRGASPTGSTDAASALRAWLLEFNALLEPPCRREEVASGILRVLQRFFPARQSALFLTDAGSDVLVVAAARGTEMSLEEAEWVERTARESLDRCDVLGRESRGSSLSSFLWVPVLCEGRAVGVIEMGDCSGHWFSGGRTRELSRLADDVGALLFRLGDIASQAATIEGLERDLTARARETREMERRIVAGAGREAAFEMATSIAERATDPISYVLSNLRTARDEVDAIQNVVGNLIEAAQSLVERLPCEIESARVGDLRAALASAETNNFASFLSDLGPLIEEAEEGTSRLESIGADFRELALGESAPMGWVDLAEVIERAIEVVSRRETGEHAIEVFVSEIPPVRCQRLRIEYLLVDMLDGVLAMANPGSSLSIQADLRGAAVIIELSAETSGELAARASHEVECLQDERARLVRDIAEDHGGRISVDTLDDQVVTRLVLPIDRD